MTYKEPTLNKPGRYMDAVVWCVLNEQHDTQFPTMRFVDGDWQPYAGYPLGHITPPAYSTDGTAALSVLNWMAKRGMVFLSNGDGDSYDCDWLPQGINYLEGTYQSAYARAMLDVDCVSFEHAICVALLIGTKNYGDISQR